MQVYFTPFFPPTEHCSTPCAEVRDTLHSIAIPTVIETYEHAYDFLAESRHHKNNFSAYRGDLTVFLNFIWRILKKDVMDVTRHDLVKFVEFGNTPPPELIARGTYPQFLYENSELFINDKWRPFRTVTNGQYQRKENTVKAQLSNLSSFYIYLSDEGYCDRNPAAVALRRMNINNMDNVVPVDHEVEKALSRTQISYLLKTVNRATETSDNKLYFERTRFLIHFMILAYPRRSEIAATNTRSPKMSDFHRIRTDDNSVKFGFKIAKSKRGKGRTVTCSNRLISALIRYRRVLGLSDYPSRTETTPLFTRIQAASHGREAGIIDANLGADQIGELVKEAFELTALALMEDGYIDEADEIRTFSSHALRHSGITIDLDSGREPKDVMKDSGHANMQSLAIYQSSRVEFRIASASLKDAILETALDESG
ncbi:tyrosine-type recombinase/integrase [Vibrio sp. Hal054]|uniref:tyrosine-type recombinase/integrase n=1 Tax=Vibrio sp. Hal054 TaxID=3035158 RepID=UPI00301C0FE0